MLRILPPAGLWNNYHISCARVQIWRYWFENLRFLGSLLTNWPSVYENWSWRKTVSILVDEISWQQNVEPPADLAMSLRALSPEAPLENAAEALTCGHNWTWQGDGSIASVTLTSRWYGLNQFNPIKFDFCDFSIIHLWGHYLQLQWYRESLNTPCSVD